MVLVEVVKRDGRREPFTPEKITVSAMKSGAPQEDARKIAEAIQRVAHDGMTTEEIRRRVLEQLREMNPRWEQHWLMYDAAIKKRETTEPELPAR